MACFARHALAPASTSEQGDLRPGAASPHAQEELRALLKSREPLYAQAELAVDTSRLGVAGAVDEIARRLS